MHSVLQQGLFLILFHCLMNFSGLLLLVNGGLPVTPQSDAVMYRDSQWHPGFTTMTLKVYDTTEQCIDPWLLSTLFWATQLIMYNSKTRASFANLEKKYKADDCSFKAQPISLSCCHVFPILNIRLHSLLAPDRIAVVACMTMVPYRGTYLRHGDMSYWAACVLSTKHHPLPLPPCPSLSHSGIGEQLSSRVPHCQIFFDIKSFEGFRRPTRSQEPISNFDRNASFISEAGTLAYSAGTMAVYQSKIS